MPRQIVCIRWGDKYGVEYVNRLYGMVARNLDDFRFFCITDRAEGLRAEVEALPLPPLGCDYPATERGIWGKSRLWQPDIGIEGPVLFIDLDVVITGRLEPFFERGGPGDVILARNPNTPFERLGQTSIYRFPAGGLVPLYDRFRADPTGVALRYDFEQRYVTRCAPQGVTFWPRGWVAHFRHHCARAFPLNFALPPKLPRGARVVIFAGGLNPPDAILGRWNPSIEVRPPMAHVRDALSLPRHRGRRFRHIRHYVRPTPWVEALWRE
jgi:hypothetical protein